MVHTLYALPADYTFLNDYFREMVYIPVKLQSREGFLMNNTGKSPKWMFWCALIPLLLGLGIALAALIAPMGVWFGLWPFGTGFNILRRTVPMTTWIAGFCLLSAIVLLLLARRQQSQSGLKFFSMALTGAIAAGLAWYIPNSYQGDFPPIHDVSTDIENPPAFVAILPLRADAPNNTIYGVGPGMTPELNAQLQQEYYPYLQPRILDADTDEVFDRAVAAIQSMGLELVSANRPQGRIEATDTTFWFRFKDDVVIRIRPTGTGQTRMDARSVSRVGRGDAGTNARRLQAFFEAFDRQ